MLQGDLMKHAFFQNYRSSILLLAALVIGSVVGVSLGERAEVVKPLGDIYLNLLFTVVVPLVFFSISSAVAGMSDTRRLGKILGVMILFFIGTGVISALW